MSLPQDEDHQGKSGANAIVGQLLQARTEGEKSEARSTKVVVDADGNKVVKVRKRKRVYSEPTETKKRNTNAKGIFLGIAVVAVIVLLTMTGVFVFRVSSYNSEEFRAQKERELSDMWGADVKLAGLKVDGFTFSLRSLQAEFPESSMIKRVEIGYISGDLHPSGFITGIFQGDQVFATDVKITLRNSVGKISVPEAKGSPLWKYNRFHTDLLEVEYEDPLTAPFVWKGNMYMRKTQGGDNVHVAQLEGQLKIRGWNNIVVNVSAPAVYVSPDGIDNISISGFMGNDPDSSLSKVTISGALPNGSSIYSSSLKLSGTGVLLKDLTDGAVKDILDGVFGKPSNTGNEDMVLTFSLPDRDMVVPKMSGSLKHIERVQLMKFPVLSLLGRLLGDSSYYEAPALPKGSMQLKSDGKKINLDKIDLEDNSLLKVTGRLEAVIGGGLTGNLNFGIPFPSVTRDTYEPDPIFDASENDTAWLRVTVTGTPKAPRDNSAELNAAAQPKRKEKPAPRPVAPPATSPQQGSTLDVPSNPFAPQPGTGGGSSSTGGSFEDFLR